MFGENDSVCGPLFIALICKGPHANVWHEVNQILNRNSIMLYIAVHTMNKFVLVFFHIYNIYYEIGKMG